MSSGLGKFEESSHAGKVDGRARRCCRGWLALLCSHKWRRTAGCGSLYGVLLTGNFQANPVSQGDSVADDLGGRRRVPGGVSQPPES